MYLHFGVFGVNIELCSLSGLGGSSFFGHMLQFGVAKEDIPAFYGQIWDLNPDESS